MALARSLRGEWIARSSRSKLQWHVRDSHGRSRAHDCHARRKISFSFLFVRGCARAKKCERAEQKSRCIPLSVRELASAYLYVLFIRDATIGFRLLMKKFWLSFSLSLVHSRLRARARFFHAPFLCWCMSRPMGNFYRAQERWFCIWCTRWFTHFSSSYTAYENSELSIF